MLRSLQDFSILGAPIHLAPDIELVFGSSYKPCSFSFIVQIADAKVLRNDVPNLGYGFIALNFSFCKFWSGRIFTHDTTGNFVY
jgi:hypothetical protein